MKQQRPRRLSDRQLHVRDRDRKQHPDDQPRQDPRSTRWRSAAITSAGARISTASRKSGSTILRYGPPIHKTYLGPGKFDWEFADLTFAELKRRDITPIVDLCHFGVPDWIGNFQNPDFPRLFAAYAGEFAERYPWVQLYTPINEMFICAVFSAKYGWWNEQKKDDSSFVTALKHLVKANVMAMIEILKRRHDAIFIQSESSEYYHADSPGAIGRAEVLNQMRFLSLDLNYGRRVDSGMYQFCWITA